MNEARRGQEPSCQLISFPCIFTADMEKRKKEAAPGRIRGTARRKPPRKTFPALKQPEITPKSKKSLA